MVSSIENVLLNGCELVLDHVFDLVGFNAIDDQVFLQLVHSQLGCPASKAATVEFLKNHFDEDVDLSEIYRCLDKLNDRYKDMAQDISVRHRWRCWAATSGVVFYNGDHPLLQTDREDDLRKTGFLRGGRHNTADYSRPSGESGRLSAGLLHPGKQV